MGGKSAAKAANREAQQARQQEAARQASIRDGTNRINSIFDGATIGSGAVGAGATYDPNATYYLADGSVWRPKAPTPAAPQVAAPAGASGPTFNEGNYDNVNYGRPAAGAASAGSSGPSIEDQFRTALAGGLFSGTTRSSGFNDDFYNSRAQSYVDYALPQLDRQFEDANKQLTFSLARSGNLDSSARGQQASELQKMYDLNRQQISDQGRTYANQARDSVESARADLIRTLNATGDTQGAINSALSRSSALSQGPQFSPLGSLFADFTAGIGAKVAADRSFAAQNPNAAGSATLFGPSNSVQNRS